MSTAATTDPDFRPGLEGVIAFESEIAEPDKEGGALRYRGVDLKDLVGRVSFGQVWGLLVDNEFDPGLPPAEPFPLPVHSGDIRVDVQSALAQLAPVWGFKPLLDIDDAEVRDNLLRLEPRTRTPEWSKPRRCRRPCGPPPARHRRRGDSP